MVVPQTETRDQFIERYCHDSKTTWEELSKWRACIPCNCDYEGCTGWGMVPHACVDISLEDNAMREASA